jgi:putative oxidoreductase
MAPAQDSTQMMVLTGRVLLALIFISSGLSKIPGWDSTVQYMEAHGMPFVPLFLFPAIFIEVIGGLSILTGFKTRIGALALLIYLVPVTLIFHAFWAEQGMDRQIQMVNFMKNLAIMGGLFGIAAHGAGILSLDYRISRRRSETVQEKRDRIRAVS